MSIRSVTNDSFKHLWNLVGRPVSAIQIVQTNVIQTKNTYYGHRFKPKYHIPFKRQLEMQLAQLNHSIAKASNEEQTTIQYIEILII
jgi:hypothetical protein